MVDLDLIFTKVPTQVYQYSRISHFGFLLWNLVKWVVGILGGFVGCGTTIYGLGSGSAIAPFSRLMLSSFLSSSALAFRRRQKTQDKTITQVPIRTYHNDNIG